MAQRTYTEIVKIERIVGSKRSNALAEIITIHGRDSDMKVFVAEEIKVGLH